MIFVNGTLLQGISLRRSSVTPFAILWDFPISDEYLNFREFEAKEAQSLYNFNSIILISRFSSRGDVRCGRYGIFSASRFPDETRAVRVKYSEFYELISNVSVRGLAHGFRSKAVQSFRSYHSAAAQNVHRIQGGGERVRTQARLR